MSNNYQSILDTMVSNNTCVALKNRFDIYYIIFSDAVLGLNTGESKKAMKGSRKGA